MSALNIAAYIKIMKQGIQSPNSNEAVANLLLSSITEQEYVLNHGMSVDINPKMVSNLLKQKTDVHQNIKNASVIPAVITETIKYFNTHIVAMLNPHTEDDMYEHMINAINSDTEISSAKRRSLTALFQSGKVSDFLAMAFLYAINRPNKAADSSVEEFDIPLLSEADNRCPLCRKLLISKVKNSLIKKYKITKIFPDSINPQTAAAFSSIKKAPVSPDSLSNKIPLCTDCADKYSLSPTADEYENLCSVKEKLERNYTVKTLINGIDIEDHVKDVALAISAIKSDSGLRPLPLNALKIEQKFTADNFILKNLTQASVLSYYNYIADLFSQMEREGAASFNVIGSEVSLCHDRLENEGFSQEEIFNLMTNWFIEKTGLGIKYTTACNIIVAFFVQNCEVFHEVSK